MPDEKEVSPFMRRVLKTADGEVPHLITRYLNQCKYGLKHVPELRSWTFDQVVEAVKSTGMSTLSRRNLQNLHDEKPEKFPSPLTIETLFGQGSWYKVLEAAGVKIVRSEKKNVRPILRAPPTDALYFLELYKTMGLKSKILYLEARRRYPEVVPAYVTLLRKMGGFNAIKRLAFIESKRELLMPLVALMHELGGRWPKKGLCRDRMIDRCWLEKKFGGKIELEELCRDLLPFYAQQVMANTIKEAAQIGEKADEKRTRDNEKDTGGVGGVQEEVS